MRAFQRLRRLTLPARGANMVEYIILVGLVALLCLAGFGTFGSSVKKRIIEDAGHVHAL